MPLSFRDPLNRAVVVDGHWYRIARGASSEALLAFREGSLYRTLIDQRAIPEFELVGIGDERRKIVENVFGHPLDASEALFAVGTVHPVTYPWEWSDARLTAAALFLLRLRRDLLQFGFDLQDASAHNVAFQSGMPILVDLGSIVRWDREPVWIGFRQFVEHFVNPLAVSSATDLTSADIWRMNRSTGLRSDVARSMMNRRQRVTPRLALVQRFATPSSGAHPVKAAPGDVNLAMKVTSRQSETLRGCIERLATQARRTHTTWGDYHLRDHYSAAQLEQKNRMSLDFARRHCRPGAAILDIGGNDGFVAHYITEHLDVEVIVVDDDPESVESADAKRIGDSRVALYRSEFFDVLHSTSAGAAEYPSLASRVQPVAVFCHAVIHHLVITQAVPLELVTQALRRFDVPVQVEFVDEYDEKTLQLVTRIRHWRGEYSRAAFERAVAMEFSSVDNIESVTPTRHVYELTP